MRRGESDDAMMMMVMVMVMTTAGVVDVARIVRESLSKEKLGREFECCGVLV